MSQTDDEGPQDDASYWGQPESRTRGYGGSAGPSTRQETSAQPSPISSSTSKSNGKGKEKETTEPREPKTDAEELDEAVGLALWGVQVVLLKTHQGTLTSARGSDRHEQQQPRDDDNDDDDEGKNGTNRSGPPSCIPSDEELDIPAHADSQPSRRAQRMRLRELKIIQEREVLGRLGRVRGERWVGKRLDWEVLRGGE